MAHAKTGISKNKDDMPGYTVRIQDSSPQNDNSGK